jgi:putative serine protease PepD
VTMEGDRPAEGNEELPYGSYYYGPFHPQPVETQPPSAADLQHGPSFESQVDWSPPVEQPATATAGTVLPMPDTAERAQVRSRSSARLVLVVALTALLVGGAAGYGGALLAGRSTDRQVADPRGGGLASRQPTTDPSRSVGSSPAPTTSHSRVSAGPGDLTTVQVAAAVLPGTVMIQAGSGIGSGFVLDSGGRIMTNNHVVAAADGGRIRVVFADGRRLRATLVGRSPSYDIAVVQVRANGLRPLPIGDSDSSRVGEPVIAVGSPLGLPGTVTQGIVSAVDRPVVVNDADDADAPTAYIDAIQTDAPINPGNSGGPLIDSSAKVIGVNSAILTLGSNRSQAGNIGLGFAIPINQAIQIGQLLIKNGKATYPVIGAKVAAAEEGVGVMLSAVDKGGPAAIAGLREGDMITKINGVPVEAADQLIVAIRTHRPYEVVMLDYRRGEVRGKARVVLGSREG